MQLFADYLQPVTYWLQAHPHWALLFTFLVAFTESLAVIGSIIPGSVTMTAVGILAGSGILRIDLTLLMATLGAIAGDSFSYMLGNIFRESLTNIWPFSRYPNWLTYGKDYFQRHGGKSVLIGRFVGPIRAVIPVIAGMMRMNHWRFFLANFVSAILWALLYVMPGVFIGLASSELSAESATRLFILVLVLLGGIWLLGVIMKWLVIRLNHFLRISSNQIWTRSKAHPYWSRFFNAITPPNEPDNYQTASLCLIFVFSLLLFLVLTIMVITHSGLEHVNQPIHLFLQSLRTQAFDVFFLIFHSLYNSYSLLAIAFTLLLYFIFLKDMRRAYIWSSLNISTFILVYLLKLIVKSPHPDGLLNVMGGYSYPAGGLTLLNAQIIFIAFNMTSSFRLRWKHIINVLLGVLLTLPAMAALYLGDNWLSDVLGAFFLGEAITVLHWLFYRKQGSNLVKPQHLLGLSLFLLFSSSFAFLFLNFEQITRNHQPYLVQYLLTDESWWNQSKPYLPVYRRNRIGKPITLFNLQYAGSLNHFEQALSAYGWKKQEETVFSLLLKRLNANQTHQQSPLLAQLYANRKPALIMTFQPKDNQNVLILRMWRSNYHLKNLRHPLWLGSVHENTEAKYAAQKKSDSKATHPPLFYISSALNKLFRQRQLPLKIHNPVRLTLEVAPELLLVEEEFPLPSKGVY